MKCAFCGNTSGKKDDRGGCVSCGGFTDSDPAWMREEPIETTYSTSVCLSVERITEIYIYA